jgi:16S rRNA (uracil1498-N3)-methyltransferase
MPRLFVPTDELGGSEVALTGEAHRYLTRVLRLGAGARVELFDGRGLEIAASVVASSAREVRLALGARRRLRLPVTPPVTVLQGLPRAWSRFAPPAARPASRRDPSGGRRSRARPRASAAAQMRSTWHRCCHSPTPSPD